MASSDDTSDAASGGERLSRQEKASAPSRRGREAGPRAPAPDVQRSRQRASTTGRRRRSDSSDQTKARRPRATTTTTAPTGKRAGRPRASGRPGPATKAGKRPIGGAPAGQERRRAAASHTGSSRQGPGLLARLLRWLRMSLRRLQRKLKRALATPQARRILTALLARRLPGPLRVLVEGMGDRDRRGFLFWWLVVTLIVTLAIALLLSIVLAPVTGIVALGGVGIWMLIRKDRRPATQPS
jgi:hypothetical protein